MLFIITVPLVMCVLTFKVSLLWEYNTHMTKMEWNVQNYIMYFIPLYALVMCMFYFQSKLTLNVKHTHD